jgi:hypothetical protein
MMNVNMIGWVATAAFAISYFFRRPATLRKIQAFAACLWIMYGVAIGALPVIVANVIVAGAALYSSLRRAGSTPMVEAVPVSGQVERGEIKRFPEEI